MGPRSYCRMNADCAAFTIELFVSYLALNLLGDLWRHRLHAVFFSGVLRRFLHQLVFGLGPSDIIAAGHHVTATKHFGHDWSS